MDSLSDFLRAKMVRLEAEHPDKMDVVNRTPQLADDLAQLYCELNLLADAIDDGCDQHDDRDEQTADGFDGEHELPPTVASPARQELQLNEQQFAGAVSVATSAMGARSPRGSVDDALRAGSSGHGADMTWVVEVNLSPQLERQLQPDPRDADSVAWIPEVGWDENALCAWVREWDDHAAMWRYTNLDTQQDTWSYPNGVEQFEPVGAADPSHGVEDTDLAEREDTLVSQPDAASTSVTAPQGAYMSLRSPDDDTPARFGLQGHRRVALPHPLRLTRARSSGAWPVRSVSAVPAAPLLGLEIGHAVRLQLSDEPERPWTRAVHLHSMALRHLFSTLMLRQKTA